MAPPKKLYRGIKPDETTFKTQQQFLDSLKPVPLDSVPKDSRKCPYCWRMFGEPNPGQDDAEQPVRFRCDHVFGEHCMRSLFAIREPTRIDLKPLSFEPGSKGFKLGSRLSAYVQSCGVKKSALLTGGNREKDFKNLLREALPERHPHKATATSRTNGIKLLGKEWYSRYCQMYLLHFGAAIGRIHLLENAIIFDIDASADESSYFIGVQDEPELTFPGFMPFPPGLPSFPPIGTTETFNDGFATNTLVPPSSTQAGGAESDSGLTALDAGGLISPGAGNSIKALEQLDSMWKQEAKKIKDKEEKDASMAGTWQDVIPEQSKLDKLMTLQKQAQEKKAEEAKTQKKEFQASKFAKPQIENPKALSTSSESETDQSESGGVSLATPLFAEKQMRKIREAADRKAQLFLGQLARTFAEIYEAYERHHYNEAVAAGLPPPVKKLKLAESSDDKENKPLPESKDVMEAVHWTPVVHEESFIHLSTLVHNDELDDKGLEVSQPSSYLAEDEDHIDEEDDESEQEQVEDDDDEETKTQKALAGKTILLRRRCCRGCIKPSPLVTFLTIPEYLFWRPKRNLPDNCPKCRRILFNKHG